MNEKKIVEIRNMAKDYGTFLWGCPFCSTERMWKFCDGKSTRAKEPVLRSLY